MDRFERNVLFTQISRFFSKNINIVPETERENYFQIGWKRIADFGLLGVSVPKKYGGMELDAEETITVAEACGYGCDDNGFVFALNNHIFACIYPILEFGTKEQKEKYIPKMVKGEIKAAHAMTESTSGSDSLSIQTKAVDKGEYYLLNGRKTFITNAPIADMYILFAKTKNSNAIDSISAFIIEKNMDGIRIEKAFNKAGLDNAPMSEIVLTNCRVPKENLLSVEGNGYFVFNSAVENERIYCFASHLGYMQQRLEKYIDYGKNRKQFDRSIISNQSMSHEVADLYAEMFLLRLILQHIGSLKNKGKTVYLESSIAKLRISELFVKLGLFGINLHGAYGYIKESGIVNDLLDGVASTIYSGTSNIHRDIIARWLGID